MAILEPGIASLIADKDEARRIVDEQYTLMGIPRDQTATAQQSRALSRAEGINPADNILSRGIVEMREEKVRASLGLDDE